MIEFDKIVSAQPTSGGEYFYGVEMRFINGEGQKKHYLKAGIAQSLARVKLRLGFHRKREEWIKFTSIKTRGRWAVRLAEGIDGTIAEKIFRDSFESHCALRSSGKRDRKEFFEFDAVIENVTKIISEKYPKYPHPCSQWQEG